MNQKMFRKMIFTRADAVLEILGYVFLLAAFSVAAVACATGVRIPEKFDDAGNIIKYGSPGILFLMPAMLLPCNLLFSLVLHLSNPNTWNRPIEPRPGREIVVYRDMVRMQTVIELLCGIYGLAFCLVKYRGIRGAMVPLSILLILGIIGDIAGMLAVAARHNRMKASGGTNG